jgi:hypothetical protein
MVVQDVRGFQRACRIPRQRHVFCFLHVPCFGSRCARALAMP